MALKPRPPAVEMCSLDMSILAACQETTSVADPGELVSLLFASRMNVDIKNLILLYIF